MINPLIKIPRNIFQTWNTKDISPNFKGLTDTWKNNNPNYAYFLFDDDDRKTFIRKHFDTRVYNCYCRIVPGAFKADLWRYCILYVYGGVYADMDTICLNPVDIFLTEDTEFMTAIDLNNGFNTGKHNLFNSFIASVAKHPILLECISRIVHNVENHIVPPSNLDFSGPGVLGRSTNSYLKLNETESFVGKEGTLDTGAVHLLHFDPRFEYVTGLNQNVLFQNKNGNSCIKNIYREEIQNLNQTNTEFVDWGTCKNPILPAVPLSDLEGELPTIVTMFYNIRDREKGDSVGCPLNHSVDKYMNHAKQFILTLPYPLLVFTDDDNTIEFVSRVRNETKYSNKKTVIYKKLLEETYYYRHLDKLTELQKTYTIFNGHLDHETPLYIILNNNKFDFIETAIQNNPFNSKHFIWMDFGINHVALNTEKINEWINRIPDKVRQMCINPYIDNIDNKTMFQYIYHHTAGGLFTGSKENLLTYARLFREKTEQIYSEGWYQIDEAVMTMVQRENPDLFDLFYGDYNGIISNYLSPIHSLDIVLMCSQKYIEFNRTKEAYRILSYCTEYFMKNSGNVLVYMFLQQNIIAAYYQNDKRLPMEVVHLINQKKFSGHEGERTQIHSLLERNKENINFYVNQELVYKTF